MNREKFWKKIYLFDYQADAAYRKPEAAQDLLDYMNRGTLLVNYVGHGSSTVWADEALLEAEYALKRLNNRGKYMVINSFSCTVGRFEQLSGEGLSELFVKATNSGAIAAVSATRESFPTPNISLATHTYSHLFKLDSNSNPMTLGDAFRRAKDATSDVYENSQKYGIFGEPVLLLRRFSLPTALEQQIDTISALQCGTLTGTVSGGSGNGKVFARIVGGDVPTQFDVPPSMTEQYADKRGGILFEGQAEVQNGTWSMEYLIPKKVPFRDSTAKIYLFSWDKDKELEGSSVVENIRISGTANSCPADDGQGPKIEVSTCDKSEGDNVLGGNVRIPLPFCLEVTVRDTLGGVITGDGPDEGTTF